MEANHVPRRPNKSDLIRVGVLLLISASIHAWLIARTEVTARDSIGLVREAITLGSPPEGMTRLDVIRETQRPPGYPAIVFLVSSGLRAFDGELGPHGLILSAQLTSAFAAMLIVVPMYFLGRLLFGPWVGFVAAGMLQLLPGYAEITSDGVADSLFLLGAMTSLWFGVRGVDRLRSSDFLLCGIAGGVAYLVRPEGLVVPFLTGCTLIMIGLRSSRLSWAMLGCGLGLGLGVSLTAGPYMALIGKLTNKPTGQNGLKQLQGEEVEPVWRETPEANRGSSRTPLAAWWHEPTDAGESRLFWAIRQVGDETFKTFHYLPALWTVIGIGWCRRRLFRDATLMLPLVAALTHVGLLVALAATAGYVSERHTLWVVAIGCLFAAAALAPISRWMAAWMPWRPGEDRFWTASLLITLIVITLPAIVTRTPHANRAGHRQAGEWLARHAEAGAVIHDPFCWAAFYAGQEPTTKAEPGQTMYIVLEPNRSNPHRRLPTMNEARQRAESAKAVYHWPENVSHDRARVVVFRAIAD